MKYYYWSNLVKMAAVGLGLGLDVNAKGKMVKHSPKGLKNNCLVVLHNYFLRRGGQAEFFFFLALFF